MRPARHVRWIGFSILLLLALLVCVFLIADKTPLNQSVFRRATRVTTLYDNVYLWRSSNLLLFGRLHWGVTNTTEREVVQLDCSTGAITPLEWPFQWIHLEDVAVSPDGRRLLIDNYSEIGSDVKSYEVLELNGQRQFPSNYKGHIYINHASNTLWFPDNRRWISLCIGGPDIADNGMCAVLQSLDGAQNRRYPSFGFPRDSARWPDTFGNTLLGFVGKDRILVLPKVSLESSEYRGGVSLYEIDAGPSPNLKEFVLPIMQGGRALDIALSPGGDRLALLVHSNQLPPLSPLRRFLSRWYPPLLPKQHEVIELYTVRLDGTEKRSLGLLPPVKGMSPYLYEEYKLAWTPEGKNLSFIHQHTLWKIPSE